MVRGKGANEFRSFSFKLTVVFSQLQRQSLLLRSYFYKANGSLSNSVGKAAISKCSSSVWVGEHSVTSVVYLDWVIELVTSNYIRSNHRIDFPIQKARGFSTPLRIILKFPTALFMLLCVFMSVSQ